MKTTICDCLSLVVVYLKGDLLESFLDLIIGIYFLLWYGDCVATSLAEMTTEIISLIFNICKLSVYSNIIFTSLLQTVFLKSKAVNFFWNVITYSNAFSKLTLSYMQILALSNAGLRIETLDNCILRIKINSLASSSIFLFSVQFIVLLFYLRHDI